MLSAYDSTIVNNNDLINIIDDIIDDINDEFIGFNDIYNDINLGN